MNQDLQQLAFVTMRKLVFVPLILLLPAFAGESSEASPAMTALDAILLGLIEGLTEYLPVSSTGHLLLLQRILGIGTGEDKTLADAYAIVIQAGAILAVLSLYLNYIRDMVLGLLGKHREGLLLVRNLFLAFLPAVVIGLAFNDWIKSMLFGLWPTAFAWFVGGLALLKWGDKSKTDESKTYKELHELTVRDSLLIGCMQCIAMWPGTSRSLVTILGGRFAGMSLERSVVFSFLLGMITLSAATLYDLLKHGSGLIHTFGASNLAIGMITAWISAILAVKWMVAWLNKHGLALFGWWRIGVAGLTVALLLGGVISA